MLQSMLFVNEVLYSFIETVSMFANRYTLYIKIIMKDPDQDTSTSNALLFFVLIKSSYIKEMSWDFVIDNVESSARR